MTEGELLDGLKCGDGEAYKELYKLHYKVLCAFAYTYVNDSFIAESLVSDVIFNLWEKHEMLNITQSLRAYLMKSVRNSCINYLDHCSRQSNMIQSYSTKLVEQQMLYHEQDNYPLCSLLERELEEKIENALASLPALTREIFQLSRNEKFKYEEIACQKNITVDIVKYHIRLALCKLKDELKEYLPFLLPLFLFS